jgi:hypothetical protein
LPGYVRGGSPLAGSSHGSGARHEFGNAFGLRDSERLPVEQNCRFGA